MLYVLAGVAIVGGILYRNAKPFMSQSFHELVHIEGERIEKKVMEMAPAILAPPSKSAVENAWADIRAEMSRYCTSQREIDGVCQAADLTKRKVPYYEQGIYAVPIHVRPSWVRGRKVWAIGYAWEPRDGLDGAPLSHFRICVFDAKPPYELLSEAGCL